MKITKKNIIFLDIDGVISPLYKGDTSLHDIEKIIQKLIKKNRLYKSLNTFELSNAYYNWDTKAIEFVKNLCENFNAFIVVSSLWREGKSIEQLKLLFKIHDLENFVIDKTPELNLYRDKEVRQYLEEHPEIEKFIIFDDNYEDAFTITYPNNFVHCKEGVISKENYELAKKILST